jgi:glycosyltransferase involved in cell wall biosynthesis
MELPLRVLFLPYYAIDKPSSRYRVFQLLPSLESAGVACAVLAAPERRPRPRLAYAPRLLRLARNADLLHVQKRALPRPVLGTLRALGRPWIYDLDDADFTRPERRAGVDRMIRAASHVIAGNEYLAEHVRTHHDRVSVIPTVVDTDLYGPFATAGSGSASSSTSRVAAADRPRSTGEIVLGWIGTNPDRGDLAELVPVLDALAARYPERVVLRVVSDGPFSAPTRMRKEHVAWRLASSYAEIAQFDVGIMPLPDTEWSRGKCGLKLIEYMASGVPAVASAIGANRSIVTHGEAGLLAASPREWILELSRLIDDPELRTRLGAHARRTAEARFSVAAVLPRYLEVFKRLMG